MEVLLYDDFLYKIYEDYSTKKSFLEDVKEWENNFPLRSKLSDTVYLHHIWSRIFCW